MNEHLDKAIKLLNTPNVDRICIDITNENRFMFHIMIKEYIKLRYIAWPSWQKVDDKQIDSILSIFIVKDTTETIKMSYSTTKDCSNITSKYGDLVFSKESDGFFTIKKGIKKKLEL